MTRRFAASLQAQLAGASGSRIYRWGTFGLFGFGLVAVLLAPAILFIEVWECAAQGEWPGWSVEDGLGLFGVERGDTRETALQRLTDVLLALPLTITLFTTGVFALLSAASSHGLAGRRILAPHPIRSARMALGRVRSTHAGAARRLKWLQRPPPMRALANAASNGIAFALKSEVAGRLPSMIKIDISPQCQLACPHCLHADPTDRGRPLLAAQQFGKSAKMSLEDYKRIIDELETQVLAVSLFYYGDPLIHPDLDAMIAYARKAGIAVHITTHFSYRFTAERIRRLVDSGLSHITVAVDGASQETYAVTRVRGRLAWVLANLEMLTAYKREQRLSEPFVEVQHLRFPHHAPDEHHRVRDIVEALGVDKFKSSQGLRYDGTGDLYNVVDEARVQSRRRPLPDQPLPRCHWPYTSTVIKANGEVLPCCLWRAEAQYVPGAETGAVGNVFLQPLAEIWNGGKYQDIRRRVSTSNGRGGSSPSFCEGCPKLFGFAEGAGAIEAEQGSGTELH